MLAGYTPSLENSLRPTLLLRKRDPSVQQQKTIRIYKWNSPNDAEKQPTTDNKQRRPTPYERPVQSELNRPIRLTRTTTTTIEIEKPRDYYDKDLAKKALGYLTYEDLEDKPPVEVKKEVV